MIVNALACPLLPPQDLHGKEGVDGSSPSEGLNESPGNGAFFVPRAVNRHDLNRPFWQVLAGCASRHVSKSHLDGVSSQA